MSAGRTFINVWLWISDKSQWNIWIVYLNRRVDSPAKHRDLELYHSDKSLCENTNLTDLEIWDVFLQ